MSTKPVKIRGRVKGDVAEIKCLMPHPMETGTRKDESGNPVPAHYIETVMVLHNDREIMSAEWGPSVSKDPYFAFNILKAAAGDTVEVRWTDNLKQSSSGTLVLK